MTLWCASRVSDHLNSLFVDNMSHDKSRKRGKSDGHNFILTCLSRVFSDRVLQQDRWWTADHLRQYMHQEYSIGDEIKFENAKLMRVINKNCLLASSEPNVIEVQQVPIYIFPHCFQLKGRHYFFYFTTRSGFVPILPATGDAQVWQEESVMVRILAGNRAQRGRELTTEPVVAGRKRKRAPQGASQAATALEARTRQATTTLEAATTVDVPTFRYWTSGDARKLFAPREKYGTGADVLQVVLNQIEQLEKVN